MTHAPDITEVIPVFDRMNGDHFVLLFGALDPVLSKALSLPHPKMNAEVYADVPPLGEVHKSVIARLDAAFRRVLRGKGYRVKYMRVYHNWCYNFVSIDYRLGVRRPPAFVAPPPAPSTCCALQ